MRKRICLGFAGERCGELTTGTRCPLHEAMRRQQDNRRRNAASTYHSPEWRRASREALARHPYCLVPWCGETSSLDAHHITPQRDGGADDASNAMTLCDACHREYESDERGGRVTQLRVVVESIGAAIQRKHW